MITHDKFLTLDTARQWSQSLRDDDKRVVATNGCFDILHVGHIRYLERARGLGDALVVGINGDDSVRALKGPGRPVNSERDRAEVIAALACVDAVVVFVEVRATQFLEAVQPTLYVKGGDYTRETLDPEERSVLDRFSSEVAIVPFETGYSTSSLLGRLSRRDG